MFRDGRFQCELVPNIFWGVAVVRLKVKKPNLPKPNNFSMTLGRTFKFSQYMHINVGD